MSEQENGVSKRAKNLKRGPGRPFTVLTAKQAQEASVRARNLRKQVRAEMLDKLVENLDFGEELVKAIKKCDVDKINILQTALRVVGLHHDQSEEAVRNIKVDANVDANVETTVKTVKFVLDKPCQTNQQNS